MMSKFGIFSIILFSSFWTLTAQSNYSIQGKIIDADYKPIDLATVSLSEEQADSIFTSDYTDLDGSFELSKVPEGRYILQVFLRGYEPLSRNLIIAGQQQQINIDDIVLMSDLHLLEQVTVTAKIPFVERKIDRMVVNTDAILAAASLNVLEILELAPGVTLDQNESIRLKGRSGVAVFIDNKPSYLSGQELANYLKSLPASTIKQIEIMTNPSAKYEAAGNSGVINIITKRTKVLGFHGNTVLSVQQGQYTRSNNSLNLNLNQHKISVYANINGGIRNSFQDLNINRFYRNDLNIPTSSFAQNSFIVKDGQSANAKIGFDYYVTNNTTVGVSARGLLNPTGDHTNNVAYVPDDQFALINRVVPDNTTESNFENATFNLYFNKQLDTFGTTLTMDADYVTYHSVSEQLFKNYLYNANGILGYQDQINGRIPSDINIYAFKIDFTKPLNKVSKFEMGVKSAFTETDNEAIYTNTIANLTVPDYDLSNRFLYMEWIHAAYLNYSRNFNRIEMQFGLRAETTHLKGNQLGNVEKEDTSFTRTYTNLFPTFYASWQADASGRHIWGLSFGRRIDRPFFQDLNPFISPLDKFTFYSGNPNLLPTYSANFSLSYSFNNFINTSLNYSITTDGINETLEIKDSIYYSRPGNISTNDAVSLSLDASKSICKWYRMNLYLELGHQIYKSDLYSQNSTLKGITM
ncbi:MAG: outer membrane beta-barrel protein [Saprospiraceae bacterium]|nr:outer membrane beta-barrel protein [Candidatus Vicinibacter affinis]